MRSLPLLKSVINLPRGCCFLPDGPMGIVISGALGITTFKAVVSSITLLQPVYENAIVFFAFEIAFISISHDILPVRTSGG